MTYIITGVLLFLSPICAFPTPKNIIDLTWSFDGDTIYWRNIRNFTVTKQIGQFDSDGNWYAAKEFCSGEHGGTHFDAPYHFNQFGMKVGDVPLSTLIVNGITINLKNETEVLKDKALLLPQHLDEWESKFGRMPKNTVVLIQFGWAKFYNNKTEYLGIDENDVYHFPGISKSAAEWIVSHGDIVGVGVDTASVDPGGSKFFAHQILAKNEIYALENVNIPNDFMENGFVLYVMPMKIREGSGAPLRLIAVSD